MPRLLLHFVLPDTTHQENIMTHYLMYRYMTPDAPSYTSNQRFMKTRPNSAFETQPLQVNHAKSNRTIQATRKTVAHISKRATLNDDCFLMVAAFHLPPSYNSSLSLGIWIRGTRGPVHPHFPPKLLPWLFLVLLPALRTCAASPLTLNLAPGVNDPLRSRVCEPW